jgi:hypothetical protein
MGTPTIATKINIITLFNMIFAHAFGQARSFINVDSIPGMYPNTL